MCTCARPYGRAGRCGFGGQGVTFTWTTQLVRLELRVLWFSWARVCRVSRLLGVDGLL
jgi:hypothetical protein